MAGEIEQFSRYNSLEFKTRKIVEGFMSGLHKSPFHGFSVEFAEHRLYNQGDSTKHIDWKLYAKSDKLFVKKYEEETNLRCLLVVDTSSSMYFPLGKARTFESPDKLTFSLYASGCLCHLFYKQRDAFGISLVDDTIRQLTDIKTSFAHRQSMFTLLEQLLSKKAEYNRHTNIAEALHKIAECVHKRSLIIIFTDLMNLVNNSNGFTNALQHLRYNKHEVILFHVCDKDKEIELNFDNSPRRFIDMETGEQIKATPLQLKEHYSQKMQELVTQIKTQCNNLQTDFVQADINKGFDQVLLPYLLKRSRLK